MVECVTAIWTYKYNNGYTVTLRGPLTARVIITTSSPPGNHQAAPAFTLKFEDFQFDANQHDKYIALDSIMGTRMFESPRARHASTPTPGVSAQAQAQAEEDRKWEEPRVLIERAAIPGEPVNAFGIPQATMRCLELAESVTAMADLIIFANDTTLGPLGELWAFFNGCFVFPRLRILIETSLSRCTEKICCQNPGVPWPSRTAHTEWHTSQQPLYYQPKHAQQR
jgi:hypothetical protein